MARQGVAFFRCCCFRSLRSMWLVWDVVLFYGIMVISLPYLRKGNVFRAIYNPPFSLGLNLKILLEFLIASCHRVKYLQLSSYFQRIATKGSILSLDSQIPCGVDSSGGTLSKSVRDVLAEKHPPGRVAAADTLLESGCADPPCYDPILFEQLTGDLIKWAALRL